MFTIDGVEVTEEQYRTDEQVAWSLRALKEAQSREVDIATAESEVIATLFASVDTLPETRRDYWLAEIAAAGIVRA